MESVPLMSRHITFLCISKPMQDRTDGPVQDAYQHMQLADIFGVRSEMALLKRSAISRSTYGIIPMNPSTCRPPTSPVSTYPQPPRIMASLNHWLDSETDVGKTITPYRSLSKNVFTYYTPVDTDTHDPDKYNITLLPYLRKNMPEMIDDDPELLLLEKGLQYYTNATVLIRPDSNRAHSNLLLRMLIDSVKQNESFYNFPVQDDSDDVGKKPGVKTCDLFDCSMKNAFYQFCYQFSR